MARKRLQALVLLAAGLAVVVWLVTRERRMVRIPAHNVAAERPAAARPTPQTVASTPTPEPPVTRHTTVVMPWDAEPTPSPTAPEPTETPTPRPAPAGTPAVTDCVAIRWSAGASPANIAEVLVEVHARNLCGRDLEPLEVWFEIGGYRQGDLVQSVRGHLFDSLPKDGDGTALIGLPGSADWYDEIKVAVVPLTNR